MCCHNYNIKNWIDLKKGQITHQDVGQMDMYVRMYNDLKRTDGDNPTIGIVLCSETSKDIIWSNRSHYINTGKRCAKSGKNDFEERRPNSFANMTNARSNSNI